MSIFGVGPILAIFSLIYSLVLLVVLRYLPVKLSFAFIPDWILYSIAAFLISVGLILFFVSVRTLIKGFPTGKLMKHGVYSVVRNPLYSSFICFIVPGLVVLSKQVLLLTIPLFMYFLFLVLIKKEESFLEETFGEEYSEYKARVNSIFPKLCPRKNYN